MRCSIRVVKEDNCCVVAAVRPSTACKQTRRKGYYSQSKNSTETLSIRACLIRVVKQHVPVVCAMGRMV